MLTILVFELKKLADESWPLLNQSILAEGLDIYNIH